MPLCSRLLAKGRPLRQPLGLGQDYLARSPRSYLVEHQDASSTGRSRCTEHWRYVGGYLKCSEPIQHCIWYTFSPVFTLVNAAKDGLHLVYLLGFRIPFQSIFQATNTNLYILLLTTSLAHGRAARLRGRRHRRPGPRAAALRGADGGGPQHVLGRARDALLAGQTKATTFECLELGYFAPSRVLGTHLQVKHSLRYRHQHAKATKQPAHGSSHRSFSTTSICQRGTARLETWDPPSRGSSLRA